MTLEIKSEVIIHCAGNSIYIIEGREERYELRFVVSPSNVLCKDEM